ncbi:MAG: TonB-dependent receptor, partial [Gammaproteobacteria bacterium]|nr:TonB-dependent receptor [Gammaproteobacteria bacterium]
TQVVNVVLFEQLSSTSLSYEVSMDRYHDGETKPGGSLSYGGQTGKLNFLVSALAVPRYANRAIKEVSVLGDLSLNDEIREERVIDQTDYTLSTNLDYQISDNSSMCVNALYAENDNPTTVDRLTIDFQGGANNSFWQREDIPGTQNNWEIGGDYEYNFANGHRFKLLAIANENETASIRERYDLLEDGSATKNLFLDSGSIVQERIFRGSYSMGITDGHDIEMGLEGAQTILDSNLRLGLDLSTGTPSADFGGLVPVDVANANTKVEEIRYEPFAIHNWQINSRMSLETSFVYESSEIEQSGDFSNKRDFDFFKPKFDYRFDITSSLQVRFLVEKFVRQIRFSDFVAATDTEDDDSDIQAGNTELRPDFWWNYNLLTEYRLPNDAGVVSANLFTHHHKDFLQRIDVSPSEDDLRSAAGNIGTGDMWVFELKGSVRLGMFNLPNVLVTSKANIRDSEVTDPFLDIERTFTNYSRGRFDIGFRHDLPRWKMNYGMNYTDPFDHDLTRYDIDDVETQQFDPYVTAFVEKILFDNITFRVDVLNATDVEFCRDRARYVGRVSANILEEVEHNCNGSGRSLSLTMSGTF